MPKVRARFVVESAGPPLAYLVAMQSIAAACLTPTGWDALAFEAEFPTDAVDHSRWSPLPPRVAVATVRQRRTRRERSRQLQPEGSWGWARALGRAGP